MPELPEVERGRRFAESILMGRTIEHVDVADDKIVFRNVAPRTFAKKLKGHKVKSVKRKGKYIWLDLGQNFFPIFHFGMRGDFASFDPPADPPKYAKATLHLDKGPSFTMTDARRFGRILLVEDIYNQKPIADLGPDPISEGLEWEVFQKSLSRRKTKLKPLLLNQSFVAGIGNWIADDVLFRAKLSPFRTANSLSAPEAKRLFHSIEHIMKKAVAVNANSDRFPRHWLFHVRWKNRPHSRKNLEGRADEGLRFDKIGGRSTVWNPSVQS